MADIELRVISDQREGLLLSVGQTVIASGFTLLRQRLAGCPEGVMLSMLVRGPEENVLVLEERLGTHHLVKSFESGPVDAPAAAPTASTPASPPAYPAGPPQIPAAGAVPSIATQRVETVLPQLARSYPSINILVQALHTELPPAQREPTLHHVGQRVGTWVYKRDYALGGRLTLHDGLRRIAAPALKQLVHAEVEGTAVTIDNSPFCHAGEDAGCHFLRGMLEGLLGGPHGIEGLKAVERECRGRGASACRFEFAH